MSARFTPALLVLAVALGTAATAQRLPPVPVPAENPITAEKALLGKILFWDEQLSSDDTMACGSCHRPAAGGIDARFGRHPGPDRLASTPDDVFASPGVVRTDASDEFDPDPVFGLDRQVTRRTSMPPMTALWSPELFWDGRAGSTFRDPQTNQVRIASGGALESQAVGPILSDVEMAHAGRDWNQVTAKLARARPLALATNWPADLAAAIARDASYPALFRRAFGDAAITATRIAFAIATYERTLVPDRTPWDRFIAGDRQALTPRQQQGWNRFRQSRCAQCHTPPLFTDNSFRNVGVRPVAEDTGRQEVTRSFADRGKFKVPSLRNVGLRDRLFHNGRRRDVQDALRHYGGGNNRFQDNIDPLVRRGIGFGRGGGGEVADFLANGLTDPRVRDEAYPFDRPTLRSERGPHRVYGVGAPGAGAFQPEILDASPAARGATGFKIGLRAGAGGAASFLVLSGASREPASYFNGVPINVDPGSAVFLPGTLRGTGPGAGHGTRKLPIPDDARLVGRALHVQWLIVDPGASAGVSATRGHEIVIE